MGELADLHHFVPGDNIKNYCHALGRFATGITVITAIGPDGPSAITANSFASVSLDPPLILWSPDKKSRRHDIFVQAQHFVVHVLSSQQRHICDGFVKSANAFDGLDTALNEFEIPVIQNCLAEFHCQQYKTIDAGDHTIILGQVLRAGHRAGEALVYANGGYQEISAAL